MKICDSHNDFLTAIKSTKELKQYISSLKANKAIKNICCVIWTTKLKYPIKFIEHAKNNLLIGNKKFLLCVEDLGFINSSNFNYSINAIIKLRPFACGLVWNYNNLLGGGALENRSLTNLGKSTVYNLEKHNIIIDTAHMNNKTFWQFCKITTKPIYNSHCNINYFKSHKRNLNSKQINYIINSNGFIGLSFVQAFISDTEIDSLIIAKQIKYFVCKYGSNNIGIGSDFYGTNKLPIDLKNYANFKTLKKALKKQGLNNKIINKILYKNFINFLKRTNHLN